MVLASLSRHQSRLRTVCLRTVQRSQHEASPTAGSGTPMDVVNRAGAALCLVLWQELQALTFSSISWSIPGNQTYGRASVFIPEFPCATATQ